MDPSVSNFLGIFPFFNSSNIDYRSDNRYKRYATAIERNLATFEAISEWADIIAFLMRLGKVDSLITYIDAYSSMFRPSPRILNSRWFQRSWWFVRDWLNVSIPICHLVFTKKRWKLIV